MHIEHVNLTVSDLDRSIAFYCDLLDLHLRWKGEIGNGLQGAHVGDDDSYLALFTASADGTVGLDYTRPGVNHIGFRVADLDETRRRVEQLGCVVTMEADYEPGRRIYCFDPDGFEIELVEY
jgi:catechol 2,3-dioxygenase-like lactoylglutathione lyase family enzyme